MNTRTIAWSVAALVVAIASCAGAQPLPPPPDAAPAASAPTAPAAPPRAAQPQPSAALPPAEIVASVRSAGFDPLSRPVRRGAVYVVFARDRYLMDVQVKIDARSGRVLAATRLAGTAYGGPGYEGNDRRRYEPAPVPPGEIPLQLPRRPPGPVAIEGGRRPTERRGDQAAPLPRARPDEVVTGEVKEAAPPVRPDAPAANPPAAAGSAKPQPAPAAPPQPVMVPVAPLE
jgi:hypothetical protein